MPNHPSADAGAGNLEVVSDAFEPSPTFDFCPSAMGAARRSILLLPYVAVYAPYSVSRKCRSSRTRTLAGTEVDFLALIVPLCGVVDLLKLRQREVDLSESLGIFAFQRGCVNDILIRGGQETRNG